MSRSLSRLTICILTVVLGAAGCSADDNNAPGTDAPVSACASIAGTWEISGGCGPDVCTITQAGCAITAVNCTSGARSTSGMLTGAQFTYDGVSGGGVASTCSGTLAGDSMSGSCSSAALGTCPFSGDRR